MKLVLQCLAFLLLAPGMLFGPGLSDPGILILRNEAVIIFPRYIKFELEASSTTGMQSITLVYGIDRLSCEPSTSRQAIDFQPGKQASVEWKLEFMSSGMIPPGAEVWWQWEITGEQGFLSKTEKKSVTVQDGRYSWNRLERNGIALQWHAGSSSFGQAILHTSEKALQRLSRQMVLEPTRKIQITVYASTEEMHEALVFSAYWAGAVALPDYSSILLGLSPSDLKYADDYIYHEITHLIVGELTYNCMGIELPTWLAEGLAENTLGEPGQEELDAVILAIESKTLPALKDIASGFSADGNEAHLEYTQSSLVVKYMLQAYGPEKMSDLLAAFQSGLMTDEALQKVYGMDTAGVDSAWRKSLGFSAITYPVKAPTRTQVPTLALWTAPVRPTNTPSPALTPVPSATHSATRTATPVPAAAAASKPSVPGIEASPKQSFTRPCLGSLFLPALLVLLIFLRKENVS